MIPILPPKLQHEMETFLSLAFNLPTALHTCLIDKLGKWMSPLPGEIRITFSYIRLFTWHNSSGSRIILLSRFCLIVILEETNLDMTEVDCFKIPL